MDEKKFVTWEMFEKYHELLVGSKSVKCIDKECEYRELNGGDEISDFYFCKACGISVNRGEDECLLDE